MARPYVVACGLLLALLGAACTGHQKRTSNQPAPRHLYLELNSWKGIDFIVEIRGNRVQWHCRRNGDPEMASDEDRSAELAKGVEQIDALFDDLIALGLFGIQEDCSLGFDGPFWRLAAQSGSSRVDQSDGCASYEGMGRIIVRLARFLQPYPFGFTGRVGPDPIECTSYRGPLFADVCTD